MLRRITFLAILFLASAAVTLGADLSGRWEGSMSTPNGDFSLTFTFKVDGHALTGTVESGEGKFDITDGKIDGDKFTFKAHAGDADISHEGTLSGDTIQMKIDGPWGESNVTLKRAAAAPPTQQP